MIVNSWRLKIFLHFTNSCFHGEKLYPWFKMKTSSEKNLVSVGIHGGKENLLKNWPHSSYRSCANFSTRFLFHHSFQHWPNFSHSQFSSFHQGIYSNKFATMHSGFFDPKMFPSKPHPQPGLKFDKFDLFRSLLDYSFEFRPDQVQFSEIFMIFGIL